jgi:TrmH family RNA methyltransferase
METITHFKHPSFRAACRLTEAAPRDTQRRFLMEGAAQIAKALNAPLCPLEVYVKEASEPELVAACERKGIPLYSVAKGLFHRLLVSTYETSTTAVAVLPYWQVPLEEICVRAAGTVLVAERIQDPRNLGMLIRTADAAQVRAIVLASPIADPYSRACVRSTTGISPLCQLSPAVTVQRLSLPSVNAVGGRLDRVRTRTASYGKNRWRNRCVCGWVMRKLVCFPKRGICWTS